MNSCGSYKKLLNNSKQAILAAIEIYNKPLFEYREEVFVILLINSWQLLFLAILSKKKKRIFQRKEERGGKDLKVHSFERAMNQANQYLPKAIYCKAFEENLKFLYQFRNNAVHYYNEKTAAYGVHALTQANIINYRDVIKEIFKQDIATETNLVFPPFSFNRQQNLIELLQNTEGKTTDIFAEQLLKIVGGINNENDKNRFIIQYSVKLESVKLTEKADAIVGIDNNIKNSTVITKTRDANQTHPFGRKDILKELQKTDEDINLYLFEAICHFYGLKDKEKESKYAWKSNATSASWRYSPEIITFIKDKLPLHPDFEEIKEMYKKRRHLLLF